MSLFLLSLKKVCDPGFKGGWSTGITVGDFLVSWGDLNNLHYLIGLGGLQWGWNRRRNGTCIWNTRRPRTDPFWVPGRNLMWVLHSLLVMETGCLRRKRRRGSEKFLICWMEAMSMPRIPCKAGIWVQLADFIPGIIQSTSQPISSVKKLVPWCLSDKGRSLLFWKLLLQVLCNSCPPEKPTQVRLSTLYPKP